MFGTRDSDSQAEQRQPFKPGGRCALANTFTDDDQRRRAKFSFGYGRGEILQRGRDDSLIRQRCHRYNGRRCGPIFSMMDELLTDVRQTRQSHIEHQCSGKASQRGVVEMTVFAVGCFMPCDKCHG